MKIVKVSEEDLMDLEGGFFFVSVGASMNACKSVCVC